MRSSDLEANIHTLIREIKAIKKGKKPRFVEHLSMQLHNDSTSSESADGSGEAFVDNAKHAAIGVSKSHFDL